MTRLFRSKSCGGVSRPKLSFFQPSSPNQDGLQLQQDEQEDEDDVDYYYNQQHYPYFHNNPITTPFISPDRRCQSHSTTNNNNNFTILALLLAALRKSLVTCSIDDSEDVASSTSSLDIGCPTDVRHVSHVTFDSFNGFLGLPVELQPDVPRKVPSASVSVFGVSAESMQCSYDERGNSVPTILLMMQKRLYSGGGLQAEGIFRINSENSQEEDVRKQLNQGFVPHEIDVHCLAGLIKAWFRELPRGVLDTLTPEQVMHCNTEEECDEFVKSLPPTEAALLDWAINLMADVVKHEQDNKMNAQNIAMVFAPNMTQMADPLTALIHAVQVMNLLKTLVIKTLGEREESPSKHKLVSSSADPPPAPAADSKGECPYSLRGDTLNGLGSESEEQFWSFPRKSGSVADYDYMSGKSLPVMCKSGSVESDQQLKQEQEQEQEKGQVVEGILERHSLRKGVRRLCRHPIFQFQFQLSKPVKKSTSVIVDTRSGGDEAWA